MNHMIVHSLENVTLVGGGEATPIDLDLALIHAPCLVAADGGAGLVVASGRQPEAVIGDMDSLSEDIKAGLCDTILHQIDEQDSTDFDKALRAIHAPLVIGVGFLGGRVDHQLANFNVLVRHAAQPCLLIGDQDVVFAAPKSIALDLEPGSRVSLFPLARVMGQSEGLHWPIEGLVFAPNGGIGTSNRVAEGHQGPVALTFDAPGMLVVLPREALEPALKGLLYASSFARAK